MHNTSLRYIFFKKETHIRYKKETFFGNKKGKDCNEKKRQMTKKKDRMMIRSGISFGGWSGVRFGSFPWGLGDADHAALHAYTAPFPFCFCFHLYFFSSSSKSVQRWAWRACQRFFDPYFSPAPLKSVQWWWCPCTVCVCACGVSYKNFLFSTQCLAFGHQPMPHRPSPFLLFSLFDFVPLLR